MHIHRLCCMLGTLILLATMLFGEKQRQRTPKRQRWESRGEKVKLLTLPDSPCLRAATTNWTACQPGCRLNRRQKWWNHYQISYLLNHNWIRSIRDHKSIIPWIFTTLWTVIYSNLQIRNVPAYGLNNWSTARQDQNWLCLNTKLCQAVTSYVRCRTSQREAAHVRTGSTWELICTAFEWK